MLLCCWSKLSFAALYRIGNIPASEVGLNGYFDLELASFEGELSGHNVQLLFRLTMLICIIVFL